VALCPALAQAFAAFASPAHRAPLSAPSGALLPSSCCSPLNVSWGLLSGSGPGLRGLRARNSGPAPLTDSELRARAERGDGED
jgi:hypothetical protein